MKKYYFIILMALTFFPVEIQSKNKHLFFDLAGVYMGSSNSQFKKDILNNGAIIPTDGSQEFENTYDIFFDGEIVRIFSFSIRKTGKIDRIGIMIKRDTEKDALELLKTFTKRELSQHNSSIEEFSDNGYPAYRLFIFDSKDEKQKDDPIGLIDIRVHHENDNKEDKYRLMVIYDDWVD